MELVSQESKSGEPIVAETSWTFYEVAYYETSRNPAFFRSEDNIDNGAYQMLRDNTKQKLSLIHICSLLSGMNHPFWHVGAYSTSWRMYFILIKVL